VTLDDPKDPSGRPKLFIKVSTDQCSKWSANGPPGHMFGVGRSGAVTMA